MKIGKILDTASNIINGERQDSYGKPEDSFAVIASFWTTYLKKKGLLTSIDGKDVALMMVLFKLAREMNQGKLDNLVDAVGYLGIAGDMPSAETATKGVE